MHLPQGTEGAQHKLRQSVRDLEVAKFEASVHFLLVEHPFGASFVPPVGASLSTRMLEPNRKPYRTRDGYLCVLPYTTRHWFSLFDLVDRELWKGAPRFQDFTARREHEVAALMHDPYLEAMGFFRAIEQRDGRFLHMAAPARRSVAIRRQGAVESSR